MKARFLALSFALILGCNPSVKAFSNDDWATLSDVGRAGLVGLALGMPAVRQDWPGLRQAATSIGVGAGISFGLKSAVHEQRPDNSNNRSFPSGHATMAFASASTLHRRYGWEVGLPAYAAAALTGSARVAARKHHLHDVAAGAAIGVISGWFFTDAFNDKVRLLPWAGAKGGGLIVAMPW